MDKSQKKAVYVHPLIFVREDFTLRAVLRAFDQCDGLRYSMVLDPDPKDALDC